MHRNSGPHGPNLANRAALDRAHHRLWLEDKKTWMRRQRQVPGCWVWLPGDLGRPLVQCEECGRCHVCGCFCWPVGWV